MLPCALVSRAQKTMHSDLTDRPGYVCARRTLWARSFNWVKKKKKKKKKKKTSGQSSVSKILY